MPNDIIRDTIPLSSLLGPTAVGVFVLYHDFILREDAEEVLIINTGRLISPEVVDECVELVFIESEVAHVLEHVLEVISANVASVVLVNQFEEVAHRHVCLLHSLS